MAIGHDKVVQREVFASIEEGLLSCAAMSVKQLLDKAVSMALAAGMQGVYMGGRHTPNGAPGLCRKSSNTK